MAGVFFHMLGKATTSVLKFCVAAHVVTEYGCEITMTVGPSMYPTLSTAGDTLLIDKRSSLPNWLTGIIGLDF